MRVIVTFLGRGQQFYSKTRYDFGNGEIVNETFLGIGLVRHLMKRDPHEDTIVVLLGTASSMWDALVEEIATEQDAAEERVALMDRVHQGTVDQACLDRVTSLLNRAIRVPCRPIVVEMARTEQDQIQFLQTVLSGIGPIGPGDTLIMDVTHGFRHLPILGLLAAMYFEVAFGCKIGGIYYGAFDMREVPDVTPVIRLDGLLRIGRWIRSLQTYAKDADPAPFVALLKADHVITDDQGGRNLHRISFFERTGQVEKAFHEAEAFARAAGSNWAGVSGLFEARLRDRLPRPGQSLFQRQRDLAWIHLRHGDYLRAAIFAFEGFVTRLTETGGRNPFSRIDREDARSGFEATAQRSTEAWKAYDSTRAMRNALAHALPPEGRGGASERARAALADPEGIKASLTQQLTILLGDPQSGGPSGGTS